MVFCNFSGSIVRTPWNTLVYDRTFADNVHFFFSSFFDTETSADFCYDDGGQFFVKKNAPPSYIPWAILALIAAYFVTFPNGFINFHTGTGTIHAALLALGAAFAWGSTTTFSKIALTEKPPVLITALRFFLTAVFAFVGIMLFGRSGGALIAPTYFQALVILIISLSTGMVSLYLYYKGLKNTPVMVSTILELFYPLIAVAIDVLVYHNVLLWSQYVAAIVLIYAMYRVGKTTSEFKTNEI